MNTVARFRVLSLALILILMATAALPILYAQEATETPVAGEGQVSATSPIVCEASVILLAGVARRDFGFTLPDDFDTFERGQFGFLFEDATDAAGGEMQATEEAGMTTTEEPAMEATEEVTLTESLVMLGEPVILDEDVRCSQLRTSLLQFFMTRPSVQGTNAGGGTAGSDAAGD
jgi:hypothetical protein